MQNFTSVSAGLNMDNREKQIRLVLYARFDMVSISPSHRGLLTWSVSAFRCAVSVRKVSSGITVYTLTV